MPVRLPTMKTPAAGLAAALLLTSCSGGGGKAAGAAGMEFRPIGGDVFAVTIGPDADVPKTEAAFRKQCEGRQACTIYGWTDPATAARSEPLTDPQTAALAVRYTHNAIGQGDMEWDCIRFRAAKAPCLPKA
jgi:hypothetical protein